MTRVPPGIRRAAADDLDGILRVDPLAARGDRERAEFLEHCLTRGECQVHVADLEAQITAAMSGETTLTVDFTGPA